MSNIIDFKSKKNSKGSSEEKEESIPKTKYDVGYVNNEFRFKLIEGPGKGRYIGRYYVEEEPGGLEFVAAMLSGNEVSVKKSWKPAVSKVFIYREVYKIFGIDEQTFLKWKIGRFRSYIMKLTIKTVKDLEKRRAVVKEFNEQSVI